MLSFMGSIEGKNFDSGFNNSPTRLFDKTTYATYMRNIFRPSDYVSIHLSKMSSLDDISTMWFSVKRRVRRRMFQQNDVVFKICCIQISKTLKTFLKKAQKLIFPYLLKTSINSKEFSLPRFSTISRPHPYSAQHYSNKFPSRTNISIS